MRTIYKIVISIVVFVIAIGLFASQVHGQNVAGESAFIAKVVPTSCPKEKVSYGVKKLAIKKVLERYNSPLLPYVNDFIATCTKYDIDCYLVPSISGLESGFGKYLIPESHNAWGFGGGHMMFDNWPHAIDRVSSTLKYNYIDKGADTIDEIAPIYAESKTWAPRVHFFVNQFKAEEEKIELFSSRNPVEL